MISEIRAPKTGLTAETLTITKWHKKEGDDVEKDELLLTIETEKTTLDINASRTGYLIKIMAQEGDTVPVSRVIGLIADSANEQQKAELPHEIPASPVARRMAQEFNIDLTLIKGTGPNGRIQKIDLERCIKQEKVDVVKSEKTEELFQNRSVKETLKVSAVRRKIVQKTVESKTQIPHYYIFSSFDMTEVLAGRKMFEQSNGIKPSIDTIMIKACALILEKYPLLNASWEQESIKIYEETRIGFIVDTGKGIMIPHLVNPHKKNLADVEHCVREFAEKARNGRISPKELECGSLSISNLGMYNVDNFVPIIYPGEVAILGLGKFQKTAFWNDEKFIPREVMKVALSLDHRVVDGAYGARFLQDLKETIEGKELSKIFHQEK